MAKYLDLTGLGKVWAKIKGNFLSLNGGTITGTVNINNAGTNILNIKNTTANGEVLIRYASGAANKTATGWVSSYGSYIYNYTSGKYLGIKEDGTPHYQGNELWHKGNLSLSTLGSQLSSVPENKLVWGDTAYTGTYTVGDCIFNEYLSPNRFSGLKAAGITIEYSTNNGSSWTAYNANDLQKRNLFTNRSSGFVVGGGSSSGDKTGHQLRVTVRTSPAGVYTTLQKFMIYVSTSYSQNCKVTIKAALENSPTNFTKVICENQAISGWSGWNIIPISGGLTTYGNTASTQYGNIQFTFTQTGLSDTTKTGGLTVYSIYAFGGVGWSTPSNMALNGHAYSYDGNMNVTFPSAITTSGTITGGNLTTSGTLTAGTIKKSGGTSSQFLKADGSVDSNTYSTTSHTHSWPSITAKLTGGNEFNIVPVDYNNVLWFNYRPDGGTGTGTVSSYIFGDGNHGRAYTEAAGYKILNGTSSQLLDASGGTCAEMTTSEINTICV